MKLPINNFSTVEPISTSNIPINSAQQAENYYSNHKAKIFMLGEQRKILTKTTPNTSYRTVRPIPHPNRMLINSAQHEDENGRLGSLQIFQISLYMSNQGVFE
jgi:hypothetical protein